MINEDAGSARVTVRLLNEIENNFILSYRTVEVDGGADGKKMCGFTDATSGLHSEHLSSWQKFKFQGRGGILELVYTWAALIFCGGGGGGGGEARL